ncbi:MAG: hypothetical protein AAB553_03430 [Patescibacteria group bacterium]
MKAEKVVLSFIAILVGLVAAGGAFYFYQMTRTLPAGEDNPITTTKTKITPSPTPDKGNILTINSPKEEEVFDKKIITVNGKTAADATVIVTAEAVDQIVKPSTDGSFSLTQTIPDGTTIIYITAIFPNGEEKQIAKTVTYTSETF